MNPGGPGGSGVEFVRERRRIGRLPGGAAQALRHRRLRPARREREQRDPLHRQSRSAGQARPSPDDAAELQVLVDCGARLRRRMRGTQRRHAGLPVDRRRGPRPGRDPPGARRREADLPRVLVRDAHRVDLRGALPRPDPGDGARRGDRPVARPRAPPVRSGAGLREGADELPRRLRSEAALRLPREREVRRRVRCADGLDRRGVVARFAGQGRPSRRAGRRGVRRPRRALRPGRVAAPGDVAGPRRRTATARCCSRSPTRTRVASRTARIRTSTTPTRRTRASISRLRRTSRRTRPGRSGWRRRPRTSPA